MQSEILPDSIEDKSKTLTAIRGSLIPALTEKEYRAEKTLLILHRIGTFHAKRGSLEQDLLNEDYTAFYGGIDFTKLNRIQIQEQLQSLKSDSFRFSRFGPYYKGGYRILGCFSPDPRIAEFAPEAEEYFTGAIPIVTGDYQVDYSQPYFTPVFNIHKLMNSISTNFDNRLSISETPEEIAQNTANFYFWGLAMVHPFIGGNHRAFDRFIEYSFAKKGFTLEIPLTQTLNIANDNPFNTAIFAERRALLNRWGFTNQDFSLRTEEGLNEWLEYQHSLNERLSECIDTSCADTSNIAKAILNWL